MRYRLRPKGKPAWAEEEQRLAAENRGRRKSAADELDRAQIEEKCRELAGLWREYNPPGRGAGLGPGQRP